MTWVRAVISFGRLKELYDRPVDIDLIYGVLMPLSAIFQLYHGDQF
jgi:hypothetical protein